MRKVIGAILMVLGLGICGFFLFGTVISIVESNYYGVIYTIGYLLIALFGLFICLKGRKLYVTSGKIVNKQRVSAQGVIETTKTHEPPPALKSMVCPECGRKYPLTQVYCDECGSLLKER